jgi:hypothetical protein
MALAAMKRVCQQKFAGKPSWGSSPRIISKNDALDKQKSLAFVEWLG